MIACFFKYFIRQLSSFESGCTFPIFASVSDAFEGLSCSLTDVFIAIERSSFVVYLFVVGIILFSFFALD